MLANQLADLNFCVDCLHGDLSQAERNKIMATFREGRLAVLVATDVAARGIDVSEVDAVINYDVPPSNEYYTHRIGRTGRAKHVGTSYLLYTKEAVSYTHLYNEICSQSRDSRVKCQPDGELRAGRKALLAV